MHDKSRFRDFLVCDVQSLPLDLSKVAKKIGTLIFIIDEKKQAQNKIVKIYIRIQGRTQCLSYK